MSTLLGVVAGLRGRKSVTTAKGRRRVILPLSGALMASCALLHTDNIAIAASEQKSARVDVSSSLSQIVRQTGIPGITFAVYGVRLHQQYSAGLADRETGEKMGPNAVIMGGSTGKVFVAAVAYQEIAKGRLHYSDKVERFLGSSPEYRGLPGSSEFTVGMLLAQTTGLVDATTDLEEAAHPEGPWTNERRFKAAWGTKLLFPPGTAFSYSDLNYQILAAVLESIEHEYFGDLVASRILQPLQMLNTKAATSRVIAGLASGYAGPTSKPQYENLKIPDKTAHSGVLYTDPSFEGGGGGFSTTSADLAKFMYSLFNANLIGEEERHYMVAPPVRAPAYLKRPKGQYGAGIFTYGTALGTAYGHGGIWDGYKSMMLYYPSRCIGAALQVNSQIDGEGYDLERYQLGASSFDPPAILTELVREVLEQDSGKNETQSCLGQ